MSYRRRGVGDWFSPDCDPGSPGCVPHLYCYIPGMATPDCLASLSQGLQTIGSDVGSAVGGTAAAAASGVVSGATSAVSTAGTDLSTPLIWLGIGGAALLLLVIAMR